MVFKFDTGAAADDWSVSVTRIIGGKNMSCDYVENMLYYSQIFLESRTSRLIFVCF